MMSSSDAFGYLTAVLSSIPIVLICVHRSGSVATASPGLWRFCGAVAEQFSMWPSLVAVLISIYLWMLTTNTVRCSDGHCMAVQMYQSVTFNCIQSTTSPDRFVLWYRSNDSSSEDVAVASCYFNESCQVNDHKPQLYAVNSRRSNRTHADTELTIRNVSADHQDWKLLCYVWDADAEEWGVMYLTEEYRLLIYRQPDSVTCSSDIVGDSRNAVITCRMIDVFPKNINCRIECEGYPLRHMDVLYQDLEAKTNAECKTSVLLHSQSVLCRISVFTGECEQELKTLNVNLTNTNVQIRQAYKVEQLQGEKRDVYDVTNFGYLSYIISALVAVIVIPVSACTLFVVCRKFRKYRRYYYRPPSVELPLYTQQSTCTEIISAQETVLFSGDSSDEWSNDSNIYSNVSCNIADIVEASHSEGDPPCTLPFTIDGAEDTVEKSVESQTFAPLPLPHVRMLNVHACADAEERMRLTINPENDVQGNLPLEETQMKDLLVGVPGRVLPSCSNGIKLNREFPDRYWKFPKGVSSSLERPDCSERRLLHCDPCCQRDIVKDECVHLCHVDVNEGCSCRRFPRKRDNYTRCCHNETRHLRPRDVCRNCQCFKGDGYSKRRHRQRNFVHGQQRTEKRYEEDIPTEHSYVRNDDLSRKVTNIPIRDDSREQRCRSCRHEQCTALAGYYLEPCHEQCTAVAGYYLEPCHEQCTALAGYYLEPCSSCSSSTRSIDISEHDGTDNVNVVASGTTVIVGKVASTEGNQD
ncbi:hypothetical protein Btru_035440 [Bulinus truncatus]|nr:hypothetical protein Btru_035440 [Bulinus truncatus]